MRSTFDKSALDSSMSAAAPPITSVLLTSIVSHTTLRTIITAW